MGRLSDRDAWLKGLPPDILSALESWLHTQDFDLGYRGWFDEGRSGEPVARVVRVRHDDTDQLVLKFFASDGENRITNIQRAWEDSSTILGHLAEPERWSIPLGSWRAVFLRVAGGDLGTVRSLTSLPDDLEFPDHCWKVVRSVVRDWNNGKTPTVERTVGSVIADMLVRRRDGVEEWARKAGIALGSSADLEMPDGPHGGRVNPFALVHGAEAQRMVDVLIGRAHGDLSGRNVLVPAEPSVAADSYVLIDYDRYAKDAPLARDPMHLLVALTLDKLNSWEQSAWPTLVRVLVDPYTKDASPQDEPLRRLSKEIREASTPEVAKGLGSEWRQQCLLSLVGAGLVHLGRRLRITDAEAAKKWCFDLAAAAAAAYLREVGHAQKIVATAPAPNLGAARATATLVDRRGDTQDLRSRLTGGPWGVTVLRGMRGIGKTKVVEVVLDALERERAEGALLRVGHHGVNAGARLDIATLIDHLEGGSDPYRRSGGSSLVRLEVALQRLGESQVVVVVDSADNLLDPGTHELVDPDLDEALEMLATEQGHRVTVLMVTQHDPASPNGGTWPTAEAPIFLGKLPMPDFFTYLAGLEPADSWNLGGLSDEERHALYGKVQGNPRLGELAHAVAVVADSGLDLTSLVAHLRRIEAKAVPAVLTRLLVDGMNPVRRRGLQALAALNTPVPATTVIDMLEGEVPAEVGRALSTLVTHRIVYRAGRDLYFLPAEDGRLVMEGMSDQESRSLYYLAADHLTQLRSSNPRDVHDLRVHFAELDALLRAREPGAAYEMIQLIDDVLREWNCSHLLFERRQGLVGEFGEDDHQEMANYNALADIHVSRGQYKEAADLYGRALTIANAQSDDFNKMKIFTNLAGLYWDWNETGHALAYYEHGRDEALRQGNPQVLMATEEGIADCHRRQGGYDEAIKHAKVALATPKQADYPDTDTAQAFARSRTVTIALKLARWLSELGRSSEAWQFVEVARTTAADHPSARLQAAYLDGWAGTMLYRDELDTAETVALSAVDLALRQRDPVVLLQARTTLCFLYLKWGRSKHARTEIELARPYRRRKFRSLVVLALLALTSHQIGDRLTAKERFRQLLDESIYRTERDPEDFAAWDFRGYALCGLHLDTTNDLSDAIAAFQTARNLTPPTPALVERMRFMIEQLDRPDLLRPVLDVL